MPPPEIVPIRAENAAGKFPLPKFNKEQANQVFGGIVDQVRTAARNPDRILNSPSNLGSGLPPEQKTELADLIKTDGNEVVTLLDQQQADLETTDHLFGTAEAVHQRAQGKFITQDQATAHEGLIIDDAGNFTGEFSEKTAAGFETKSIAAEVTPSIQGLRRLKEEVNPEAAKLYQELSDSDSVRVTYKTTANGAEESVTLTLAEFDPKLEAAAAQEWMAKHPEISYEDAKKKFPEAAHAYRIKAEQAMNTRYTLHHKQDAPAEETDPAKPKQPEAKLLDERKKNVLEASAAVAKPVVEKAKKEDITDPAMQDILFLRDQLSQANTPDSQEFLSSLLTQSLTRYLISHPEAQNITGVQDSLNQNQAFYAHEGNDPVLRFARNYLIPAGYPEDQIPKLIDPANPNGVDLAKIMTLSASLRPAIEKDTNRDPHNPAPSVVAKVIESAKNKYLNGSEVQVLNKLLEGSNGLIQIEGFHQSSVQLLGLTNVMYPPGGIIAGLRERIPHLRGPHDLREYMRTRIKPILEGIEVTATGEELKKVENFIVPSDKYLEEMKKNGGISSNFIMGLMLALQLIQGVLEEGVTKDSGGGAPPS